MLPVEVMPVARKPDVFGRAVTPEEGRKLAQIARRSKVSVRMRRAVVVMASAQHQPVGAIAKLMQVSEAYVRQVIHDFNAHGFEALDLKWSGAGQRRPRARRGCASAPWTRPISSEGH
ncbi:helix-turn-helix domain-containing protein [Nocardia aurea]|uniref:Helix-turn-helix domain-containing protein n=1 Tax=Nocardia aurea TaxID=2144174 RepID=A0ABV3G3Y2_9NOCA